MATLEVRPKIDVETVLRLSFAELAALDALAGYGVDEFLKVFYEKLGKAYLTPYENGLRSLFESVRKIAPNIMDRKRDAEKAFIGEPK